ncbi:hypothetical protein QBC46DRAFT_272934, partial [Diplogelasinospora grovesii]
RTRSGTHTLKDLLFSQRSPSVALVGLGGVGKTQVALELAYWARENHPEHSIFWVPALSGATFEQAYAEIAKKLAIRKAAGTSDTWFMTVGCAACNHGYP